MPSTTTAEIREPFAGEPEGRDPRGELDFRAPHVHLAGEAWGRQDDDDDEDYGEDDDELYGDGDEYGDEHDDELVDDDVDD